MQVVQADGYKEVVALSMAPFSVVLIDQFCRADWASMLAFASLRGVLIYCCLYLYLRRVLTCATLCCGGSSTPWLMHCMMQWPGGLLLMVLARQNTECTGQAGATLLQQPWSTPLP